AERAGGEHPDPAPASGAVSEASTPTRVSGIDPATRRHRHPPSHTAPSGTASWRHTTESSSAVRVTQNRSPAVAHGGAGEPAGSLQTANVPGTPSRLSRGGTTEPPAASPLGPPSRLRTWTSRCDSANPIALWAS